MFHRRTSCCDNYGNWGLATGSCWHDVCGRGDFHPSAKFAMQQMRWKLNYCQKCWPSDYESHRTKNYDWTLRVRRGERCGMLEFVRSFAKDLMLVGLQERKFLLIYFRKFPFSNIRRPPKTRRSEFRNRPHLLVSIASFLSSTHFIMLLLVPQWTATMKRMRLLL
jgi:hypothetical protein